MKPLRTPRAHHAAVALGLSALVTTSAAAAAATPAVAPAPASAPTAAVPAAPARVAAAPRTPSKVTVASRRLNVRLGRSAYVRGTVRARAPRLVRLQRRTPAGRWSTIARDRPDARGRYELRHRPTRPGSVRIRVRFSGDERNRRATRPVGRLNAFRTVQASWYGPGFMGGRTACGGRLDGSVLGVAHKSLPCGTRLMLRKGAHTVRVRVIDRGPFIAGRELDLTPATKRALRFGSTGAVGATR